MDFGKTGDLSVMLIYIREKEKIEFQNGIAEIKKIYKDAQISKDKKESV